MVSMFFVGLIYPVFEPSRGNFPLPSSYHEAYSDLQSRFPLERNQAPKGRFEIRETYEAQKNKLEAIVNGRSW